MEKMQDWLSVLGNSPDSGTFRMELVSFVLQYCWWGMLLGVISGAVIGLFFHREDWMGGYNSFRRRLTRLGHISFFGLAFVNLGFALTLLTPAFAGSQRLAIVATVGFCVGAALMPTICFLTAWKKPFRHLFFLPVGGVTLGIVCTLMGL